MVHRFWFCVGLDEDIIGIRVLLIVREEELLYHLRMGRWGVAGGPGHRERGYGIRIVVFFGETKGSLYKKRFEKCDLF